MGKYCHTKWWGCTQFGSIGCGVSKAEGKWVETEKGRESVGDVKLDFRFNDGYKYISNCWDG